MLRLQQAAGNRAVVRLLKSRSGAAPAGRRLLSRRLSLDAAKAAWIAALPGTPSIPSIAGIGQFYATSLLRERLKDSTTAVMHKFAGAGILEIWGALSDLPDAIDQWDTDEEAKLRKLVETGLADPSVSAADRAAVHALLGPGVMSAQAIYDEAHAARRAGRAPKLPAAATIGAYKAVHKLEANKCGETAGNLIGDALKHGSLDPSAKRSNPKFKSLRETNKPLLMEKLPHTRDDRIVGVNPKRKRGDILNYDGLASAVADMRDALDDGFLLHARVASGVDRDDQPSVDRAEHSIVILGHNGGTEFIFWDPDRGSSKAHGEGFGSLFYDAANNRLSTARDDANFLVDRPGFQPPPPGAPAGQRGEHRYQVVSIYVK